MRKRFVVLSGLALLAGTVFGVRALSDKGRPTRDPSVAVLKDGDILFQQTGGEQGRAVQLATGSPWTHVGIAFKKDGQWMVYEAVGPVRYTPLEEWTGHGANGHWVAKRWVGADRMDSAELSARLHSAGERFLGLPYDLPFRWSDERIYCSELVWKMYAEGLGVHLCEPKPMREHALGSATVQRHMQDRYGNTPPLDEPMIAPGALYDCATLKLVARHPAPASSVKVR